MAVLKEGNASVSGGSAGASVAIEEPLRGVPISTDNSPRARRILQIVHDLVPKPISNCRVLDLACAHGAYSIELARRGAEVVGIEGREAWLAHGLAAKASETLDRLTFLHDDVRNLRKEKHGSFDVVLCLGLLYHLDAPDCLDHLAQIFEVCDGIAVIDTQIGLKPEISYTWRGKEYWGVKYPEHPENLTHEQKMEVLGASLDNNWSFWLTRNSLLNALRDVGFSSVYECKNPIDNMYVNEKFFLHEGVITLVARKGRSIGSFFTGENVRPEEDWPESVENCTLPSPLYTKRANG